MRQLMSQSAGVKEELESRLELATARNAVAEEKAKELRTAAAAAEEGRAALQTLNDVRAHVA